MEMLTNLSTMPKQQVQVPVMSLASLIYCYILVPKIPNRKLRLFSLAPAFHTFALLPWCFSSILARCIASFFVTWITSFKLVLFCFDKGPLVTCSSFQDFVALAVFPAKLKADSANKPSPKSNASMRYEFVRVMERPYLATSLQDFWGKRWNRMSSDILRVTIYDPTCETLTALLGKGKAKVVAMITTLVVSGIMHEMVFYYITCGAKPSWEITWFFVLHGIFMVFESLWKYCVRTKGLRPMGETVANVLTVGFVIVTFYRLLILPVWRSGKNKC